MLPRWPSNWVSLTARNDDRVMSLGMRSPREQPSVVCRRENNFFPVGQYPRHPKVKVVYPHHIFILKNYSQNGRFFCLNLQSRMWHTLSLTKEFKQFRCRQNYAIPIQSHIKWMLLTAAKSIPQIMSNQSGEDTATKEMHIWRRFIMSFSRTFRVWEKLQLINVPV